MFWELFKKKRADRSSEPSKEKDRPAAAAPAKNAPSVSSPDDRWMLSQLAALYDRTEREQYRSRYCEELGRLGFSREQAERLLAVERSIIRRFNKTYLLSPEFTQSWFMGLQQPFFLNYPKTQEDVLKERFFTLSELSKFIDEAEWLFWNAHEEDMDDDVFAEIDAWRLRGQGGEFGIRYCESIAEETGIPVKLFGRYISHEGAHLSRFKWGRSTSQWQ